MPTSSSPGDPIPPAAPSAEVRGLVSFVLFVHLFVVAIALTAYTSPSSLQERLRDLFAPYLVTLNFDLNPNAYPMGRFYLTHERETDVDATIHIDARLPDGTERSLTIPEPGLWPGERLRHYQALANAAQTLVENDEMQAALPRAIAGSVLREWGATGGEVRIQRHLLLQPADVASRDSARNDPLGPSRYSTVYDAHVLVSSSGQVDLVKKVAAGETAPVDKRAGDKKAGDRAPGGASPDRKPQPDGAGKPQPEEQEK